MGFFSDIYGDSVGRATIVLPNYSNKPVREFWFDYPAQVEDMEHLVEENKTKSVWYSPLLYASDSRTKENSISIDVVAADADTCEPENFRIRPTYVVESSAGRYQVYWKLTESGDPTHIAKVNRRIAQAHKDQGCDTAFVNAAKLMRVPGTSNHKHPGAIVILAEREDFEYTLDSIEDMYPASETPDADEYEHLDMPAGLEEFVLDQKNRMGLISGLPNSMNLRSLMMDRWVEEKRSEMRFKLLHELYRQGLDDSGVMAIAWWAPSNKYQDDPRGIKGLWDEAIKAKQNVERENTGEYDQPIGLDEAGWGQEAAPPEEVKATDFLTEEERQSLPVCFVDEWIAWAATKTDAPAEYHRAAAVTLLSSVYSEFGHAFPAFGELKLNIWMMVLGRSTKDRKSTSRGYLAKAFRALRTDDYNYDLGDDVTPSGISLALHDRANKASVFSRDEVQGLFKELLHQSYMSGGLEVFTKLYDGWSGGRVRATGEKKVLDSVPVSFLMFLMGILTETTEVLTVTNYRSGFLTRFVYVIGSRPDGYEAPPLKQGVRTGQNGDPVFDGLMNHLISNRSWWEMRGGDGKTFELMADEDAWDRYLEFTVSSTKASDNTQYAEVISSTTERMQITVLKLATIFAMDDRSLKIKLIHMLQAISFAGEWFDNAVTVASMVSESEWQRDVDKLEAFINQKGGKISYAMAYRAFKDKRAFEFEEMVVALERRGVLNRIQNGSRWTLEIEYHE